MPDNHTSNIQLPAKNYTVMAATSATPGSHKVLPVPCLLIGFGVVDEVRDGVQSLLHRKGELVVHSSQEVCDLAGGGQIRGALDAHTVRVQLVRFVKGVGRLLQVPAAS